MKASRQKQIRKIRRNQKKIITQEMKYFLFDYGLVETRINPKTKQEEMMISNDGKIALKLLYSLIKK